MVDAADGGADERQLLVGEREVAHKRLGVVAVLALEVVAQRHVAERSLLVRRHVDRWQEHRGALHQLTVIGIPAAAAVAAGGCRCYRGRGCVVCCSPLAASLLIRRMARAFDTMVVVVVVARRRRRRRRRPLVFGVTLAVGKGVWFVL